MKLGTKESSLLSDGTAVAHCLGKGTNSLPFRRQVPPASRQFLLMYSASFETILQISSATSERIFWSGPPVVTLQSSFPARFAFKLFSCFLQVRRQPVQIPILGCCLVPHIPTCLVAQPLGKE